MPINEQSPQADVTLSDPAHASMLCLDQGYGAEGRVQFYGAMSAYVDLPKGHMSGLEMDWLWQDVQTDELLSLL